MWNIPVLPLRCAVRHDFGVCRKTTAQGLKLAKWLSGCGRSIDDYDACIRLFRRCSNDLVALFYDRKYEERDDEDEGDGR